ncbi:hypothetical protein QEN19_000662 [Hanseniaspora menglaensis]
MFRLSTRINSTVAPLNLIKSQLQVNKFGLVSSLRFQSDCSNKTNSVNFAKLPIQTLDTVVYTTSHEWIAYNKSDKVGFLGVTQYAANHMGDVTYVELTDVEETVDAGESFGSIESVKSSNEIYTPYEIEVLENNMDALNDTPQLVTKDAMGEAWLLKVKVLNEEPSDVVMDLEKYEQYLKECDE